jgi:hypothetical protein
MAVWGMMAFVVSLSLTNNTPERDDASGYTRQIHDPRFRHLRHSKKYDSNNQRGYGIWKCFAKDCMRGGEKDQMEFKWISSPHKSHSHVRENKVWLHQRSKNVSDTQIQKVRDQTFILSLFWFSPFYLSCSQVKSKATTAVIHMHHFAC